MPNELPLAQRVSKSSTRWTVAGHKGTFRYVINHGMLIFHWASSNVPFWIKRNKRDRSQVVARYGEANMVASFERIA